MIEKNHKNNDYNKTLHKKKHMSRYKNKKPN